MAEAAARRVPNVRRVENQLSVTTPKKAARGGIQQVQYEAPQGAGSVVPAGNEEPGAGAVAAEVPSATNFAMPAAPNADSSEMNQRMADACKQALKAASFGNVSRGVSLQFQGGVVTISGQVASPQVKEGADTILSQVPGVRQIDNQLQVGAPNVQSVNYQPTELAPPPVPAGPPGAMVGPPPGSPMGPPPVGPQSYPTPTGSQGMFDQPNLPNYSWPTYGSYPNYAQVAYPKQYSASAWPYIGPFYPYPQVPLGWRKVQMEWDDGYWQLNFRPRTEKWWWYLNPNNW